MYDLLSSPVAPSAQMAMSVGHATGGAPIPPLQSLRGEVARCRTILEEVHKQLDDLGVMLEPARKTIVSEPDAPPPGVMPEPVSDVCAMVRDLAGMAEGLGAKITVLSTEVAL